MKKILISLIFIAGSFTSQAQAQAKPADSTKSARDYIIENENKRTVTPNKIRREIKTIHSPEEKEQASQSRKTKKCCLFCKKKKKSLAGN